MTTTFRLRPGAWQIRAIEVGIRPTANAVANAAGISKSVMYRATKGHPPSAATIAALLTTLGGSFESLFESVPAMEWGDPPNDALCVIRPSRRPKLDVHRWANG